MKSGCLLLLTACIDPGEVGGQQVQRRDPAVRLRDYAEALRFWLHLNDERIERILFVENSGYNLDALREIARLDNPRGIDVELIHAGDNVIPPGITYAYPEMRMMDAAIDASRLWQQSPEMVIKVTGRLKLPRISRLLDRLSDNVEFVADSRLGKPWRIWQPVTHTDSWLFISTKAFFEEEIRHLWKQMRPVKGYRIFEDVLCRHMQSLRHRRNVMMRFPVSCDPVGHSGFNNRSFNHPKRWLMLKARALARHVCPWWWI